MNDYQDTPTVIGSRGGNRGTTNAAAIKAAKRSGETKVNVSYAISLFFLVQTMTPKSPFEIN